MKRSIGIINDVPLTERDKRLVESIAAALAAYFGSEQSEKYKAMAMELLKKKRVSHPEIETLVG